MKLYLLQSLRKKEILTIILPSTKNNVLICLSGDKKQHLT